MNCYLLEKENSLNKKMKIIKISFFYLEAGLYM